MDRATVRCERCGLNQWKAEICVRCRQSVWNAATLSRRISQTLTCTQHERIGAVLSERARQKEERIRRAKDLNHALGLIFFLVRKARQQPQGEYGKRVGAWPGWVHKLERPGHLWTPKNIERAAKAIDIPPAILVDLACIVVGSRSVLIEEGLRELQELGVRDVFFDGQLGERCEEAESESLCG
jgi:hypothetical protein